MVIHIVLSITAIIGVVNCLTIPANNATPQSAYFQPKIGPHSNKFEQNEILFYAFLTIDPLAPEPHVCGGSLLNARAIITAAHCFDQTLGEASKLSFARYGVQNTENVFWRTVELDRIYRHPKFVIGDDDRWNYDIAIVSLKTSAAESKEAKFAKLDFSPLSVGDRIYVYGFGENRVGNMPANLQRGTFKVIENRTNHFLTLGYEEKMFVTQGDSGGPAVKNGLLVGTVIGTLNISGTEINEFRSAFTSLHDHRSFIEETLKLVPSGVNKLQITSFVLFVVANVHLVWRFG